MDTYETKATYNLAETCCASISLNDLIDMGAKGSAPNSSSLVDFSKKLTYGSIRGSDRLRQNLAMQYPLEDSQDVLPSNQILVTNGAIQANFLSLYSLVGPEDHVICQFPTYQQLYDVPRSFGADVSLWRSNPERGWAMDIERLQTMIKPNTKLIIIK